MKLIGSIDFYRDGKLGYQARFEQKADVSLEDMLGVITSTKEVSKGLIEDIAKVGNITKEQVLEDLLSMEKNMEASIKRLRIEGKNGN